MPFGWTMPGTIDSKRANHIEGDVNIDQSEEFVEPEEDPNKTMGTRECQKSGTSTSYETGSYTINDDQP